MTSRRELFQKLGRELLQTETSAVVHGHREASRLPGTAAAEALEQATAQLEWFAKHPRQAIQTGTRPLAASHD